MMKSQHEGKKKAITRLNITNEMSSMKTVVKVYCKLIKVAKIADRMNNKKLYFFEFTAINHFKM